VAYLVWNEGAGDLLLLSLFQDSGRIARRFANWTTTRTDVGDRASQMSTGRVAAVFTYRAEFRVSFEMRYISANGPSGNGLERAQQFMRWAENGGLFTVAVEDEAPTSDRAAFCAVPPTLTLADPRLMLYTLSVQAVSNSGGAWVANYDGARE